MILLDKILTSKYSFLIVLAFPISIYLHTVFFDFSPLDDYRLIVENMPFLSDLSNIDGLFTQPVFPESMSINYYRPILMLTFMFDSLIAGNSPWIFHLSNILLHITASLLVYILFRKLNISRKKAILFSLIFSVHPIHLHAVAWIPGRNDSLLAIFILLTIIFLYNFLTTRRTSWLLLHLAAFFIALLTKETAIAFFVLIPLFVLFYRKNIRPIKIFFLFISWVSLIFIWFIVRTSALDQSFSFSEFSISSYILDFLKVLTFELGKIFIPANQSILSGIMDNSLIYGVVAITIITLVIIKLKFLDKKIVIIGLVWFFITLLLPTLFLFFIDNKEFAEHRLYLPSIGILILISQINFSLINKYLLLIISISIIITFSIKTIRRSFVYKDERSIALSVVKDSPNLPMAYNIRGNYYESIDNYTRAIDDYSKAIALEPELLYVNNRSHCYIHINDWNNAINDLNFLCEYDPSENFYLNQKAKVLVELKRYKEAELIVTKILQSDNLDYTAHNTLGNIYIGNNELEKAILEYDKSIEIKPEISAAYQNKGVALGRLFKFEESVECFDEAIRLDSSISSHYANRANALLFLSKYKDAIKDYNKALQIDPEDYFIYEFIGLAYYHLGDTNEAIKYLKMTDRLLNDESVSILNNYKNQPNKKSINSNNAASFQRPPKNQAMNPK